MWKECCCFKGVMLGVAREQNMPDVDVAAEALDYDFLTDKEECYFTDLNVPYHHNLKKTLVVKSNILINGFIPPYAERFSIDLCTHLYDKFKNKKGKQIAFHFNPRFGQNCVVRNSYINGDWGLEEVHATKKNPFKRGQMFIMEIYVMKTEYLVSVNGVHFCSFTHRIHPSNVDSIDISGDIQLLKVELSVREMYPSTETSILLVDDPLNKMGTPYIYRMPPSGLRIGSKIEISGRVKLLPQAFYVRLQCGPEVYPHPTVPYQLSVKWRPEKARVTINYWIQEIDDWGPEIICPNAFKPNGSFVILIKIDKVGYHTEVAQSKFPLLENTTDLRTINTISLQGDIVISDIKTMY